MESYLWVILGSALGGAARYGCSDLAARRLGGGFPWGTLAVNILGSFSIGIVDAAVANGTPARQFLTAGLCGGFTTFSAFSLETLQLLNDGHQVRAGLNVSASVATCLIAVLLGHVAGAAFRGA